MTRDPDTEARIRADWTPYLTALREGRVFARPRAPEGLEGPFADLELAALAGLWPGEDAVPLTLWHVSTADTDTRTCHAALPLEVAWCRFSPGQSPPADTGIHIQSRVLVITDRVDLRPEWLPPAAGTTAGLVLLNGPLYPAAIQRLTRLFGCPIHQALPHPEGGWWAFGRHAPGDPPPSDDGLRLRVLPGRNLRLLDGFGQVVAAGQVGYLCPSGARFPEKGAPTALGLASDSRFVAADPEWLSHAFLPLEARQFGDGNRLDCLEFSRIMARVGACAVQGTISSRHLTLRLVCEADTAAGIDADTLRGVLSQRFETVTLDCIPDADSPLPFSLDHAAPGPRAWLWRGDSPAGSSSAAALSETLRYLMGQEEALILLPLDEGGDSPVPAAALLATHLPALAQELALAWRRAGTAHLVSATPATDPARARRIWVDWVAADPGGLLLVGDNDAALKVLRRALDGEDSPPPRRLRVFGIDPRSQGALAVARPAQPGVFAPVGVVEAECRGLEACGLCRAACPVDCIQATDSGLRVDHRACLGCLFCVERCPTQALHPHMGQTSVIQGDTLTRLWGNLHECVDRQPRARHLRDDDPSRRQWRKRLTGHSARPRKPHGGPPVVLGLAMVTMMEHAAALLVGGKLVAAVEEERLTRIKHYRFRDPDFPLASPASDPSLPLFAPLPARSIEWVLHRAGLRLEDVDLIAINGLPHRLHRALAPRADGAPMELVPLQSGRLLAVPHHLSHAACCAALAGWRDEAHILTVDGRGDHESAAFFRLAQGRFFRLAEWPFAPDRSIGGVYETATRALGFGSHGQGQLMALAAFGEPSHALDGCFSGAGPELRVSEWLAHSLCRQLADPSQPPTAAANRNLAATVQRQLETLVFALFAQGGLPPHPRRVGLAGGVALNCRMNGELWRRLGAQEFFVPPAAHDAGTAIGAAALGHAALCGEFPDLSTGHSFLGPAAEDSDIAAWLAQNRIPHRRPINLATEVAALLAEGALVGWVQDRLEFGPRALGARSILADPRRAHLKDRLNRAKGRQLWRPFGVSILAGEQATWFVEDWDSRYMLAAVQVRPEQATRIPLGLHQDGSTRPQVVHPEPNPRYHALIRAFADLSGVPLLVNTSFNRGGEPIVNSPAEALHSWQAMGLDALVLGDCLLVRERNDGGP